MNSFLLFSVFASANYIFNGAGPLFLRNVIETWGVPYAALDTHEHVEFTYTHKHGNDELLDAFGAGSETYEFGFLDPYFGIPPNAWGQPEYYLFPVFVDTLIPIVNLLEFVEDQDLVLSRPLLADIFMGKVGYWNDSLIQDLNPGLLLPNEPIIVLYLADDVRNLFFTEALSSFSQEWNQTHGINRTWPDALTHLPNFIPVTHDDLDPTIRLTPFCISYMSPSITSGEYYYARLINKAGNVVGISADTATDAMLDVKLDENFNGDFGIDSTAEIAWPLATYIYLIVGKNYTSDCKTHRELFLWLNWIYVTNIPREHASVEGFGFVSPELRGRILKVLRSVECEGVAFLAYEHADHYGAQLISFLAISIVLLVATIFLSIAHIWSFRQSKINFIYSSVFLLGIILTFISPIYWYQHADSDRICQARLWTLSIGFSILLGTMFSRTWQLREIYLLQKKPIEQLRNNISIKSSLYKLILTITIVISLDIFILTLWNGIDPYSSEFEIIDHLYLTGQWGCNSKNLTSWIAAQISYMCALIVFGIYVIYQTWSFQKKVIVVETRWVLLALYNVVLNIIALAPFFAVQTPESDFLSVIVIISIDFSGTGIICAVLLPRLIEKLEISRSSDHKGVMSTERGDGTIKTPPSQKKLRSEVSRTPEEFLAERLANPQPLKIGQKLKISPLPSSRTPEFSELSPRDRHESRVESLSVQLTPAKLNDSILEYMRLTNLDTSQSNRPGEVELSPMIAVGESDRGTEKDLTWARNPIQEES